MMASVWCPESFYLYYSMSPIWCVLWLLYIWNTCCSHGCLYRQCAFWFVVSLNSDDKSLDAQLQAALIATYVLCIGPNQVRFKLLHPPVSCLMPWRSLDRKLALKKVCLCRSECVDAFWAVFLLFTLNLSLVFMWLMPGLVVETFILVVWGKRAKKVEKSEIEISW